MIMNRLEKMAMSSALRKAFLRHVEAPILRRIGGRLDGARVLEVGGGCGFGVEILTRDFGAAAVTMVDLDPEMVGRARRRLGGRKRETITVLQGDLTDLPFPDQSFDAVVDFAAVHHVPDWKAALAEIRRVLRGGGRFFFEEVTVQWIQRWPYRVLFDHPGTDRFTAAEFTSELAMLGFATEQVIKKGGDFVFGIGRRPAPEAMAG